MKDSQTSGQGRGRPVACVCVRNDLVHTTQKYMILLSSESDSLSMEVGQGVWLWSALNNRQICFAFFFLWLQYFPA